MSQMDTTWWYPLDSEIFSTYRSTEMPLELYLWDGTLPTPAPPTKRPFRGMDFGKIKKKKLSVGYPSKRLASDIF